MSGKRRKDIMDLCDDICPDFEDTLKDFIDGVEQAVVKIVDSLDIDGLQDLHKIEDAQTLASDLAVELY